LVVIVKELPEVQIFGSSSMRIQNSVIPSGLVAEALKISSLPSGATELRLEVFTTGKSGAAKATLVLSEKTDGETQETDAAVKAVHAFPTSIRPVKGRAHLTVPARMPGAPAGTWQLSARLDGDKGPLLALCGVTVDGSGRLGLDDSLPAADAGLMREVAALRRGRRLRQVLGVARPLVRRLPPSARKKVRRLAAKLTG
jgi:hypothetical protein